MEEEGNQLDIPQEPSFMTYYRSLGLCPKCTFRLFDRGDYYTVHGLNAEYVAKDFLHTLNAIKYIGADNNRLASVALSQSRFESLLRHLLIENRYRVEIHNCKKSKLGNEWSLDVSSSAGNLGALEELAYSTNASIDSRGIAAIQLSSNYNSLGIAFVDVIDRQISFCQFEDNEYLSNLESLLVRISPKECLIPLKDYQQNEVTKNLIKIIEKNDILNTGIKGKYFNGEEIERDLNKLVDNSGMSDLTLNATLEGKTLAKESLSAVISHLNLIGDDSNFDSFEISEINLKQFVSLDSTAIRSLNLFPNSVSDVSTRNNRTLFQVLNKCCTLSGQRLLSQFIRNPLTDANKIEERLDIVEYFVQNIDIRRELSENYLKKVPDLTRISKKLYNKTATLQDCYRIYLLLKFIPDLKATLKSEQNDVIKHNFIERLENISNKLIKFNELLENVIDEERIQNFGEYWIRPDYDDELKAFRKDLDSMESEAKMVFNTVDKDLKRELKEEKSFVKLESSAQGFVFKISLKNEKAIRNNDRYFVAVDHSTKKDGIRFLNKKMRDLNDQYSVARNDYERHQNDLVIDIITDAAEYSDSIKQLENILTNLDVFVAIACASCVPSIPYKRPKILSHDSGKIELKQVRHPCLELQDDISYIPNDILLDSKHRNFYFITGPNMGGKSTYIRSIGLCVLMAQIGSFVAADDATISVVDAIFTRVGAGDKQIKGISTFMSEMVETAAIFRSATQYSLILIDELGRGTSTYDGFGLAWAISEHIAKEIKSYTLFATHFHELTDLAKEVESIGNLSLSALTTSDKLTMLYQVNEGICDQSFGIHVAEIAHFPPHIIEFAKQKLLELEGSNDTEHNNELIEEIMDNISKQTDVDIARVKSLICYKSGWKSS